MRNWLLIIIMGLSNLALAQPQELDPALINVFNTLQAATDEVKQLDAAVLQSMNAGLKQLEQKFRVEAVSIYETGKVRGTRYIIKNVTLEPMVVAKEFANDEQLLALMVSNNIVAADASCIVYVLKEIK